MQKIQEDFDRIAVLSEQEGDHGGAYNRFLLRFVPARCDHALEIGCGTGSFTRLLASRARHVSGIDLSGEMIRVARGRSTNYSNIEYEAADVLQTDLPTGRFDCIAMIATLHHLPNEVVLKKVKQALAPGGTLIIHDLLRPEGILDQVANLVRFPTNVLIRWSRTGKPLASRELRRAWAEHGKAERYLTMREVKAMRDGWLPGAHLKQHLLWRYSLVWKRAA